MTADQAENIVDALSEYGVDAEVREDYSGRGMYGNSVPAIVINDERVLMTIGYVGATLDIELEDLPRRTDSMGRDSIIVY